MNNTYSLFFKAFVGGGLAGISLSEGNYIFMLLGISLLWSASRNPLAGFCWGAIAILWSHRWLLSLHPIVLHIRRPYGVDIPPGVLTSFACVRCSMSKMMPTCR